MTNMTGREFKAFMADPDVCGPQDSNSPTYCDDTAVTVNGTDLGPDWIVEEIAADDDVKITAGYIHWTRLFIMATQDLRHIGLRIYAAAMAVCMS